MGAPYELAAEAAELLTTTPARPERHMQTVAENRASLNRTAQQFGQGATLWSVQDGMIGGRAGRIPVRVYRPGPQPRSVLVYAHGGGWALGNLDTHDALCRNLAQLVGCAVVSVDYRQPPEHPFPAAVHDVVDVVRALLEDEAGVGLDGCLVAVGGDSAGGNLTAVAVQQLHGAARLVHQLLLMPALDARPNDWPSYEHYATGLPLTREDMVWYFEQYGVSAANRDDPNLAPLRRANLTDLPAATIVTAEYDVLRDEAEAYSTRLEEAGVPVALRRFDGMFHTFILFTEQLNAAREAQAFAANRLRASFAAR